MERDVLNIYEFLKNDKWMLSWMELGWFWFFCLVVFFIIFVASLETNKIWDNTEGNNSLAICIFCVKSF